MAIPIADAGPDQTFAFSALPAAPVMAGSGTDPDLGAITGFLWEILEKPAGSAAALSSTTAQNPTLNDVDIPGTYLLFLIVTDDQAETSDDNPLTAPASARVHVNAETQYSALVKPSRGEHGWEQKYWDTVDEVDDLRNDIDSFVDAEGELVATVVGTRLLLGFNPLIVDVPIVVNNSKAACAWRVTRNIFVDTFAFQLADAGEIGSLWTISLYTATPANYESNTYAGGSQLATKLVTAAAAHGPEDELVTLGTPATVAAGRVLAVLVENAPLRNGPPKEPGTGLSVTVGWRRNV